MRTALVSDIHGNYAGLRAVLADIEQQCDRYAIHDSEGDSITFRAPDDPIFIF